MALLFKTINDVVGASHLDIHLRCIHEIIYKYTASSDDVQRKRSITLHSVLTEWCPLYYRSFSDYPGAPVPQWVKRWPTDLADRVGSSLQVKFSQP